MPKNRSKYYTEIGDRIHCYVTRDGIKPIKTADVGEYIGKDEVPVEEHGDYIRWVSDEESTNELLFQRPWQSDETRAIQNHMKWQINLTPIWNILTEELNRIIERDNDDTTAKDVMEWVDANVDEEDIAIRGGFYAQDIAEIIMVAWRDEKNA